MSIFSKLNVVLYCTICKNLIELAHRRCYIMFLKQSFNKKTGKTQLSFIQGYRQDGKVKHKVIENLGFLEDLQDNYEDPISHFKKVAKEKTDKDSIATSIELDLQTKLADNTSERRNLGYAIPKAIYSKLCLREFFQSKQRFLNIDFKLNSIFSLLVFNRFMFPSSKKNAYETRNKYFESFDFSLADVYRSLDYFSTYSSEIQQAINASVSSITGRDSELGYYDVTNYYFEIPNEDEDIYDDDNNKIEKLSRKRGPSKEHRKDPIVQMGLLMDSNGIPMAFNTFSGNQSEKLSLLPTIRRVKKEYSIDRIIVVADRGLNTSDNTAYLSGVNANDKKDNDGYVYGQSILGASKQFKEWVLNQDDYVITKEIEKNGTVVAFKHKSRIYAKKITLKDSKDQRTLTMVIYQKQMVYYSEKYAKKQRYEREKAIAKAKELIASPTKYNKSTSFGAAAYINNISFSKKTGEIVNGKNLSIDEDKIAAESRFDGYYSIVTSEKNLTDKEIRDIYKGLWEIEESFKIIKSEFKARPVFVKTPAHIEAHFLICFVALVIMRVLEHTIVEKHSVKQIRNALCNYSCSHIDQNYYLFDYRDDILKTMENTFGFDLSKKIMSLAEIKKVLKYQK